tara:strand:- start:795 stop:1175 length:381 start_codon:yes stop_codon:yes gene_type:complete
MMRNFFLVIFFIILSIYSFGEIVYQFEDSAQEKRFYTLISEIRCPKCTSGSIASSDAPVSRDLKNKVYELIITGSSDDEIKKYVSDRFGNFSDYRPAFEGANYILWFAPFIFFFLMIVIFLYKQRF